MLSASPLTVATHGRSDRSIACDQALALPRNEPGRSRVLPIGKKYRLPMATIGHWKDGVTIEEYLQQIGLGH
jgi:hypothetical protein